MSKRKICIVLTARASYTKFKTVLKALKSDERIELQIICAGSSLLRRFGAMDKVVEEDGFTVNERIYMVVEGENLLTSAKTTGLGMIEFATAYERLKPDCVVVMADRFEQLSAALPATYMNIPLAHIQGGEVSGNIDEKVRHAITKLADLHFPATKYAYERIVAMGENPDQVFLTGCPSTDLCQEAIDTPAPDVNIYKKYGGVGSMPDLSKGYLLVMQHPVTTEFGSAKVQAEETLKAIAELKIPTLWFWPNIDAGSDETSKAIRLYREHKDIDHIHFFLNMEPPDFLRVLNGASAIIGNSSCGIRESSYLGTPSVNIGSRQSDRERGDNVIDVEYDSQMIIDAVHARLSAPRPKRSTLYGDGKAGEGIAKALATAPLTYKKRLSYVDNDLTNPEKKAVSHG